VNSTIITIPPREHLDETTWIVGFDEGQQVEVNVLVERVWLSIENENKSPSVWKDKPVILSRDDFSPTSHQTLYLKFPQPRWIEVVSVGFEQYRSRSYKIPVEETIIGIPLRDFGDSYEIENEELIAVFSSWLTWGNELFEIKLASIPSTLNSSDIYETQIPHSDNIGYGRKNRAVAKAILLRGPGKILVNEKPMWDYFENAPEKAKRFMRRLLNIKEVSTALLDFQVQIMVKGSSPYTMQQGKAATHALARALMTLNPNLKHKLKKLNDFGGVKMSSFPKRFRKR